MPSDASQHDASQHDPTPEAEVPDSEVGDTLPADLDVTGFVGPTVFPDVAKRRIAGTIYFVVALTCIVQWSQSQNEGLLVVGVLLAIFGGYHFLAAWKLAVLETDALAIASRTVGFPVGHASAQLAWYGLRSRPAWRILLYSADDPPSFRGLVECDAVDGHVMGSYTERNPEDWSQYGLPGTNVTDGTPPAGREGPTS